MLAKMPLRLVRAAYRGRRSLWTSSSPSCHTYPIALLHLPQAAALLDNFLPYRFSQERHFRAACYRSSNRMSSDENSDEGNVTRPSGAEQHKRPSSSHASALATEGVDQAPTNEPKSRAAAKHEQGGAPTRAAADGLSEVDAATCVVLFGGQGSQYVGMAEQALRGTVTSQHVSVVLQGSQEEEATAAALALFERASKLLGYDVLQLCTVGPQQRLDSTALCQPAVFVASLAAAERLSYAAGGRAALLRSCVATAGFSLGEVAALVFAGAISFDHGCLIVKARAELMQTASEAVGSGMLSCFLTPRAQLGLACQVARDHCSQKLHIRSPVCQVANYLTPEVKVIAGHNEALDFVQEHARDFGIARTKRLAVSGAFHTSLMASARAPFLSSVHKLERNFSEPEVPVVSGLDATAYSVRNISRRLADGITRSVRWEQVLHTIYQRAPGAPFPVTYECGPGGQLGSLLRLVNRKAHAFYVNMFPSPSASASAPTVTSKSRVSAANAAPRQLSSRMPHSSAPPTNTDPNVSDQPNKVL